LPINDDLGELPKAAQDRAKGWKPDPTPRFGQLLAHAWMAAELARDSDRLARFRHSDAGACARALAYAALDVPPSDPIDTAGVFITTQGQRIHAAWQEALQERYGVAANIEVAVVDGDRGGHIDAVIRGRILPTNEPWVTAVEVKSVGGFRFKKSTGCPPASRVPEGPEYSHIIQASLGARRVDADEAVVLYLTREAISIEAAARSGFDELGRIIAEWTIDKETYTGIAEREIERVTGILALVDDGQLPRRIIPDPELPPGHLIVRPAQGGWAQYDGDGNIIDAGSTWHCNYCRWQTLCATHQAGRMPITGLALGLPL
jgi:hypothetical protein